MIPLGTAAEPTMAAYVVCGSNEYCTRVMDAVMSLISSCESSTPSGSRSRMSVMWLPSSDGAPSPAGATDIGIIRLMSARGLSPFALRYSVRARDTAAVITIVTVES